MVKKIKPLEIGMCSWSVHHEEEPALRAVMNELGLRAVHLALGYLLAMNDQQRATAIDTFHQSPLVISAGMVGFQGEDYGSLAHIRRTGGLVPDATAADRAALILRAASICQSLRVTLLTTHIGFVPSRKDRAAFDKLVDRLQRLLDLMAPTGVTLCFETGQETAADLHAFLQAIGRPNVGVNFDPANMILYGKGDPVDAVNLLMPYVRHVHAKDARKITPPNVDAWAGVEVPLGQGDARLDHLIAALSKCHYSGALAIEREAGENRRGDVQTGIEFLRAALHKAKKAARAM
jgi:sugar phosphate isomerase/epimerase